MKKYNEYYLLNCMRITLFLSVPIALLFLLVSIFNNGTTGIAEEIFLIVIAAFLPLLIVGGYCAARISKVKRLVSIQEKQFDLELNFENVQLISESAMSPIYATNDILIICGKLVLHKDFIKSWKTKFKRQNMGNTYYFVFDCKNGNEYKVFVPYTTDISAIRNWLTNKPVMDFAATPRRRPAIKL